MYKYPAPVELSGASNSVMGYTEMHLKAAHEAGRASRDVEVEALQKMVTAYEQCDPPWRKELQAEVEALRADAERYRAIRNPPYSDNWGDLYAMTFQRTGDLVLKGDELDKRADQSIAARAAQEK